METKLLLAQAIRDALVKAIADGKLQAGDIPEIVLEVPPKKELGDFACNIAMQSARVFKIAPRQIAEILKENIVADFVDRIDIAGPGFINFYLKSDVIYKSLQNILEKGQSYGRAEKKAFPKIQVEYVSANPTGLLHVGHGRGAAFGSALVNLLRFAGYDVEAEYYINDAGSQIDNLAASVNARYLELFGQEVEFPENGYRGQDIIDTAKLIFAQDGDKYLKMEEIERISIFKEIALKEKLAKLKEDLKEFNVEFDTWFSERIVHPEGVQTVCQTLLNNGNMYEQDGALWLKSTAYGDDKDRVVIRENGVPTYLAADIAYHDNKMKRGFDKLINIWGADHHGYIARVKAALAALGYDPEKLEVLLLQMVSLFRNGKLVKMSKRTGQSITLEELIEEVGTDAARFFFIMRSLDSQLDFDLDLAKSRSNENPVFYIQYAHARICSIFRQMEELKIEILNSPRLELLIDSSEIALIKKMLEYPEEIEIAAKNEAPHRIATYVYDLASLFHSFYNKCRIIGVDEDIQQARLGLVRSVKYVLVSALGILGVSAPEKM